MMRILDIQTGTLRRILVGCVIYFSLASLLLHLPVSSWIIEHALAVGFVLAWIVYRIAFSKDLDFLDQSHAWKYGWEECLALFGFNRPAYWEARYGSGELEFLRSQKEKPRHYAIAGAILDRFPNGASVLDVGCGYGTLYPLICSCVKSYMGIDVSTRAIEDCRSLFQARENCSFEVADFEKYRPDFLFDVVVLNEVLYYFPMKSMESMFRRAMGLLKDEKSILIISTGMNIKAVCTRFKLSRLAKPELSMLVTNEHTQSRWTISLYSKGSERNNMNNLEAQL